MCTVSVIRSRQDDGGWSPDGSPWLRVVCNRDELRSRPTSLPPQIFDVDGVRVVMPLDPPANGTWIAATEAGIVFALLNAPNAGPTPLTAQSRGQIIRRLAGSETIDEVARRVAAGDWRAFRAWRLIALDAAQVVEAWPQGSGVRVLARPLPSMFMTTASSLDEAQAMRRRSMLFLKLVRTPSAAAQDAFHAHQWVDHPELSVLMTRENAVTVSRTVVEVTRRTIRMAVEQLAPGRSAPVTVVDVPRALPAASVA